MDGERAERAMVQLRSLATKQDDGRVYGALSLIALEHHLATDDYAIGASVMRYAQGQIPKGSPRAATLTLEVFERLHLPQKVPNSPPLVGYLSAVVVTLEHLANTAHHEQAWSAIAGLLERDLSAIPEIRARLVGFAAECGIGRTIPEPARARVLHDVGRPYLLADPRAYLNVVAYDLSRALAASDITVVPEAAFLDWCHFLARARYPRPHGILHRPSLRELKNEIHGRIARRFTIGRTLFARSVDPWTRLALLLIAIDFRVFVATGISRWRITHVWWFAFLRTSLAAISARRRRIRPLDRPAPPVRGLEIAASAVSGEAGDVLVTRAQGGLGDVMMMRAGLIELARRLPSGRVFFATNRAFFDVFSREDAITLVDIEATPIRWDSFGRDVDLSVCPATRVETGELPRIRTNRIDIFARAMGVEVQPFTGARRMPQPLDDAATARADALMNRFATAARPTIGVQLRTAETYRDAPNLLDIARALADRYTVLVFDNRPITALPTDRFHVIANEPLAVVLGVVARLDAVITPDSFTLHFAGAYGIPCVSLFGPTDGAVRCDHYPTATFVDASASLDCVPCWRNEFSKCRLSDSFESVCMTMITTPAVTRALEEVMRGTPTRPRSVRSDVALPTAQPRVDAAETPTRARKTLGTRLHSLFRDGDGRVPDSAAIDLLPKTRPPLIELIGDRATPLSILFPDGISPDDPVGYAWWLSERDALGEVERKNIRRAIERLRSRPRLAFLILADGRGDDALLATLRSIATGLHAEVEISVLLTPERPPGSLLELDHLGQATNPVHMIQAPASASVADLFNLGLQACHGDFLGLVEAGDLLSETAAFEFAHELAGHPQTRLIYCDEDSYDAGDGRRGQPLLKPDWDPDAMLAQNQVGRLALFRTDAVRQLGGMRAEFGDDAEHDLILRMAHGAAPDEIRHLASILYHRRGGRDGPRQPRRANARVVSAHLDAIGASGCVVSSEPGKPVRVAYPIPRPPPPVSIVVPTRDRVDLLRNCLEGLLRGTRYAPIDITVVDNDSREPATAQYLAEVARDPRVRVMRHPGPFNWAAMNNRAIAAAPGEIVVLLNNDIEVFDPTWLDEMAAQALRPEVGVVGAKLLFANRTVQHAGIATGPAGLNVHVWRYLAEHDPGYLNHLAIVRNVSSVTGACIAFRKSVFTEVGGLDEARLPVNCSDTDLCFRVRTRGFRVIWTPFARLIHAESATLGRNAPDNPQRIMREQTYLRRAWQRFLETDPYFNAHLVRDDHAVRIATRWRPSRPWDDA